MPHTLVALVDIGKTNSRLALLDPHDGREIWSARRTNAIVHTALGRELDVAAIERWLIDTLRDAPHTKRVSVIVPVAHGAAAVLVDRDNNVVAAPDYEDPRYESLAAAYRVERDQYEHTFSPELPLGLNLGRQLFCLEQTQPELFAAAAHVLLYPQYWAWRFSGIGASEITSLGCHSDLWRPREMSFSALARRRNWTRLLPALRFAGDILGPVTPQMVAATGLDPGCQVACGIHDSNCSYLKFFTGRSRRQPFSVISSGTWTVVMTNRADLARLREDRDMLANVDAFGSPVATARFMGGREYEAIARGANQSSDAPTFDALIAVMQRRALALPCFASGGPFSGHRGKLIGADALMGPESAALATLYMALMCDLLIESLAAQGDVIVDGPLASNPLFGPLLSACRPTSTIWLNADASGTARSAAYLAGFAAPPAPSLQAAASPDLPGFEAYRQAWRQLLPSDSRAARRV